MSNENQDKRPPSVPHMPKCTLKARAVDLQLCMTEKEDKEQLGIQFCITQDGEHQGKFITRYFFFTDAAAEFTFKAMRALGWKGVDPTDFTGMTEKEVLLVIDHEADEKNGGQRAVVKWVNSLGVAVNKPLVGNRLAQFKSRVAGLAAKQANANGATNAAKLPPVADGHDVPTGEPPPWMRG